MSLLFIQPAVELQTYSHFVFILLARGQDAHENPSCLEVQGNSTCFSIHLPEQYKIRFIGVLKQVDIKAWNWADSRGNRKSSQKHGEAGNCCSNQNHFYRECILSCIRPSFGCAKYCNRNLGGNSISDAVPAATRCHPNREIQESSAAEFHNSAGK